SLLFFSPGAPRVLHSFPTRRSSDLNAHVHPGCIGEIPAAIQKIPVSGVEQVVEGDAQAQFVRSDRARGRDGAVQQVICRRRWCRSEEHTSELQSRENLVCRLLLEKK